MKIEWLFTGVSRVGSPDRAERDILGMVLGDFWANLGRCCSQEATLLCRNPLLSPNMYLYLGPFIENRVIADETSAVFPAKVERKNLRIFRTFLANSGHFCGRGAPL